MTTSYTEVVQTTSDFHDQVSKALLGIAEGIFDNPAAFDAANDVFNLDAGRRENLVQKFIFDRQLALFGLLFGLISDHTKGFITLKR